MPGGVGRVSRGEGGYGFMIIEAKFHTQGDCKFHTQGEAKNIINMNII